MELKEGYKQTEVGVIPEEWVNCKFEDVLTGFSSGQTPYRAIDRYYTGNIPWITSGELNYNIITDTIEKITKEAVVKTNLKIIPKGTFLFAITGLEAAGTRGSCAITGVEATTNQSCMALYPKKDLITTDYLFQFYVKYGDWLALQYCQGTKQQSYTGRIAKRLPIVLPPTIEEQTAIATALSDINALISRLETLIAKKRAIKQGAMQQLLKPKEGWVVKKLGEVTDENKKWSFTGGPFGSNLKSSDYTETGVRIIQLQNIGNGIFIQDSEVYTSEEKANELISCNIYPGEIILSKMGDPVARACIIPKTHNRYLMCSDGIRLAVDLSKFNTFFIYTYINSPEFRIQAESSSTGSTRKRIGLKQLRDLELSIPSFEEQTRIAQILSDMATEIAGLEQRLAKYKCLKQGMMQELLTGKTRLI